VVAIAGSLRLLLLLLLVRGSKSEASQQVGTAHQRRCVALPRGIMPAMAAAMEDVRVTGKANYSSRGPLKGCRDQWAGAMSLAAKQLLRQNTVATTSARPTAAAGSSDASERVTVWELPCIPAHLNKYDQDRSKTPVRAAALDCHLPFSARRCHVVACS
jgi:hypothetical protein